MNCQETNNESCLDRKTDYIALTYIDDPFIKTWFAFGFGVWVIIPIPVNYTYVDMHIYDSSKP